MISTNVFNIDTEYGERSHSVRWENRKTSYFCREKFIFQAKIIILCDKAEMFHDLRPGKTHDEEEERSKMMRRPALWEGICLNPCLGPSSFR